MPILLWLVGIPIPLIILIPAAVGGFLPRTANDWHS